MFLVATMVHGIIAPTPLTIYNVSETIVILSLLEMGIPVFIFFHR
jgi:hypothetical protein